MWFWFAGLPLMLRPGCAADFVFFGPSAITGWFRTAAAALSVAGLVACVGLVGLSLGSALRRFRGGLRAGLARPSARRPQAEIVLVLLSMGLLALSVATVEYLIRANDIQDVGAAKIGSVAQLIPLLAGVLACFLTVWRVLSDGLLFRKRCWLFLGWHL